jgi:hypothetical protein
MEYPAVAPLQVAVQTGVAQHTAHFVRWDVHAGSSLQRHHSFLPRYIDVELRSFLRLDPHDQPGIGRAP